MPLLTISSELQRDGSKPISSYNNSICLNETLSVCKKKFYSTPFTPFKALPEETEGDRLKDELLKKKQDHDCLSPGEGKAISGTRW